MPPTLLQVALMRGFEYPAFVSWPHNIQSRGAEIVAALATALEDRFRDDGGAPVFLDKARLKASYIWDTKLRKSVARSAVAIVFLLPTYFMSEYCRIEWSIIEQLQRYRIPSGSDHSVVIPICLSNRAHLPVEVSKIQYDQEFQQLLVFGRDITTHENWRNLVGRVAEQIYEILELVCRSDRDWSQEEAIALKAAPKAFTWPPAATKASRSSFPRLVVEKPAA